MRELLDKRKHFRSEPQNDIHKTNATSAMINSVNIGPAVAVPAVPAPAPLVKGTKVTY